MKRIVLTFVALFSMTMAFADHAEKNHVKENKTTEVSVMTLSQNYDMTLNYRKLGSALGLNGHQMEAVETVHNRFIDEMNNAGRAEESNRKALVKEAANKELKYMSYILDESQYKKFTTLLNLTLNNRGLLK